MLYFQFNTLFGWPASVFLRFKYLLYIQCIRKVFTALNFFHILLCYSLIPKWIKFFLKILHTTPHNDMKNIFLRFLQIYFKKLKKRRNPSKAQNWAQVHPVSTDVSDVISSFFLFLINLQTFKKKNNKKNKKIFFSCFHYGVLSVEFWGKNKLIQFWNKAVT